MEEENKTDEINENELLDFFEENNQEENDNQKEVDNQEEVDNQKNEEKKEIGENKPKELTQEELKEQVEFQAWKAKKNEQETNKLTKEVSQKGIILEKDFNVNVNGNQHKMSDVLNYVVGNINQLKTSTQTQTEAISQEKIEKYVIDSQKKLSLDDNDMQTLLEFAAEKSINNLEVAYDHMTALKLRTSKGEELKQHAGKMIRGIGSRLPRRTINGPSNINEELDLVIENEQNNIFN